MNKSKFLLFDSSVNFAEFEHAFIWSYHCIVFQLSLTVGLFFDKQRVLGRTENAFDINTEERISDFNDVIITQLEWPVLQFSQSFNFIVP